MTLWDDIVLGASQESPLWAESLLPRDQRELIPVFSPLGDPRFGLAVETIYEGYLLHYGRSRLFDAPDADTGVLLGDYLYAHGLVRLAEHGNVVAVADLAELISLCAQLRAEGPCPAATDGAVWAATASRLGVRDPELDAARAALRLERDAALLERLAARRTGEEALGRALAAHGARVE